MKAKILAQSPPADLGVLLAACEAAGFGGWLTEYRFDPSRRWRFDVYFPRHRVAFEREGGTWGRGRHVRAAGYAADCEKYNAAAVAGVIVIRATADMIRGGLALAQLLAALRSRT